MGHSISNRTRIRHLHGGTLAGMLFEGDVIRWLELAAARHEGGRAVRPLHA